MIDALAYASIFLAAAFALAMLTSKRLLHSVLYLAGTFAASALLFMAVGFTLLGLMQFLIFVGGMSTYLVVSASSGEKAKGSFNTMVFVAIALALSAALASTISASGTLAWFDVSSLIAEGAASYNAVLYAITATLSLSAVACIVALKKGIRLAP